ncbi:carbohydrate ABC transporter permease [Treponema brennaborense]|uniref:ABC-type transporter, integral membrane subunit n=1 Tax=Treponema brennaborense (strain DSM 12168 / CIP 105900 / DD5/3) TaxID=906968 RepID=F4LJQ2_TREBD|nr:carbohydrate ABC transporter permease [Treponema brennaborense]AEE17432.1 ABC-type transporter, integral membrane subunit [Treponema brennaborense DSM 12168]
MATFNSIPQEARTGSVVAQNFTKGLSYFIFILWTVVTIAPLVWMLYSSFKTNEELNSNIYSLPHAMFDNKEDEYVVVAPQLNIVYPKKLQKQLEIVPGNFDDINEKLVILESTTIGGGRRLMVQFLERADLSDEMNARLVPNAKITLNELPKSYQRSISWNTIWWNYTSAWKRGSLGMKFLNSIIYTVSSTFFVVLFGLMIGYGISKFKYKRIALIVSGLIGLGYLLDVNQVIIPLFLMMTGIGLTDTHIGIIMVYIAFGLPLSVMLCAQFIKGLPNSLIESAYIDGAKPFRTFVSIICPMTVPVIVTISIMTALNVWNEFLLVLIFASKEMTKSLPVGVYSFSSRTGIQLGWQIAALIIATVPVMIVYFAFQKELAKGVAGGAIKE